MLLKIKSTTTPENATYNLAWVPLTSLDHGVTLVFLSVKMSKRNPTYYLTVSQYIKILTSLKKNHIDVIKYNFSEISFLLWQDLNWSIIYYRKLCFPERILSPVSILVIFYYYTIVARYYITFCKCFSKFSSFTGIKWEEWCAIDLTHFMLLVSFYTPWIHQKRFAFLMFSGGIERDRWLEMG